MKVRGREREGPIPSVLAEEKRVAAQCRSLWRLSLAAAEVVLPVADSVPSIGRVQTTVGLWWR